MDNYEKLQLSKQDLKYIYTQLLHNILGKLDLHLPTSDNDPLKTTVTNLLHEYLKEVFETAKHAMVIDGVDMALKRANTISDLLSLKTREKTESFDFELNSQLKDLLQQIEQETIEVTDLRKNIPQEFGVKYELVVADTDKLVTEFLTSLDQLLNDQQLPEESKPETDEPTKTNEPTEPTDPSTETNDPSTTKETIPRLDQMVEDYEAHLHQLHTLKDVIPKQRAEIDKLNEITQFLQDKYQQDTTNEVL